MSAEQAKQRSSRLGAPVFPGARSLLFVALLAVIPYLLLPSNPFIIDAPKIAQKNEVLREGTLAEVWTNDFWGVPLDAPYGTRSYRPLVGTTYFINARTSGFEPRAFHITDMLLHAGGSVLFALLIAALIPGTRWSIPMGIIFAVHPLLSESVVSFVGRADMMASIAILAALLLHLRADSARRPWLFEGCVLLLTAAAMLSKEYGIAAPFILLCVDAARYGSGKLDARTKARVVWTVAGAFVLLGLYLSLRYAMIGALGGVPMIGAGDMPLYGKSLAVRWGTAAWLLIVSLRLVLMPIWLNYFYSAGTVDLAEGLLDPRALIGVLFVVAWIGFAVYSVRKTRAIAPAAGAALFFLPLGPTLNTVSYSGVLFAERFLYMPLAGFVLLVAYLFDRRIRAEKMARIALVALTVLTVVYVAMTTHRVRQWRSEQTLVEQSLKSYPRSMIAHLNAGWHLLNPDNSGRDPELALNHFDKALEVEQRNPVLWTGVATALFELERFDEAAHARRKALDISDGTVSTLWLWLGEAELRAGDLEQAVTAFEKTEELEPDNPLVKTYLGNSLLRLAQSRLLEGKRAESITLANRAIDTASLPGEGVFLAAQIVSRAGQRPRAAELYSNALELDPDILRKRHQAAIAAGKAGNHLKAAALFREILDAQPDHVRTLFNLGRSLVLAGRARDAIGPLSRGLELKEDPAARNWLKRARSQVR